MPRIYALLPGILLSTLIYLLADLLSNFVGKEILFYEKSPISTVLFAILIGIVVGNFIKIGEIFTKGINFSLKFILRLGIILLGIRIGLTEVFTYGSVSIPLIIICIITVLLAVRFTVKYLKISTEMSYLIAIGTSICGVSAIVAMAPVINAKKGEITYAIANITIFGMFGMLFYPYVANSIFNGEESYIGLFLGTAIHDTAQVIASGLIYEQQFSNTKVLEISTITKLVRNTFLLVMIPLFAYFYNREQSVGKHSIKGIFPLFVIGFLLMVIIRTIGDEIFSAQKLFIDASTWKQTIALIKDFSGIFLSIAMAALGLSINIKELKGMGYKPFIVGFTAATVVGLISLITITTFSKINLIH